MRWLRRGLGGVLGVLGASALFFLWAGWSTHYPLVSAPRPPDANVRGAYHVHSTASDGRGSWEEIARAAREAGLDFVVMTDHNLNQLPEPAYLNGVLMVPAVERSKPEGHLVELKDWSAVAHPIQRKRPWTDWEEAKRVRGFELYSADSLFRTAWGHPVSRLFPAVASFLARPTHGIETIVEEDPEGVRRLLALAREAPPKVALCAHDAHGWPPYRDDFRALAMYLPLHSLPADARAASDAVLSALGSGSAYCVFQGIGEGTGFSVQPSGAGWDVRLPAVTPAEWRVEVRGAARALGTRVERVGLGPFWVEVWARVPHLYVGDPWKPWLVSSPTG